MMQRHIDRGVVGDVLARVSGRTLATGNPVDLGIEVQAGAKRQ